MVIGTVGLMLMAPMNYTLASSTDAQLHPITIINKKTPGFTDGYVKKIGTKTIVARGWAGGQPKHGYTLEKGDGLSWSKGGGPTVSVSASFGLGKAFGFDVSLGNSTGSNGATVNKRAKKAGRYKIYVNEYYKVTAKAVYGKLIGHSQASLITVMHYKSYDRANIELKKV